MQEHCLLSKMCCVFITAITLLLYSFARSSSWMWEVSTTWHTFSLLNPLLHSLLSFSCCFVVVAESSPLVGVFPGTNEIVTSCSGSSVVRPLGSTCPVGTTKDGTDSFSKQDTTINSVQKVKLVWNTWQYIPAHSTYWFHSRHQCTLGCKCNHFALDSGCHSHRVHCYQLWLVKL